MLTVTIRTDGAAFEDDPYGEAARLLREIANDTEQGANGTWTVRDANGNATGTVSLTREVAA